MLRGGAFKPRTSPYSFQGLHAEGIKLLLEAKEITGLPIVTEIMNIAHLPLFEEVDVIQVGARNMQNFELLKELGGCKKPILLKRGMANTIQELLMSAEYIMAGGNRNVILAREEYALLRPPQGTHWTFPPSRSCTGFPIFPSSSTQAMRPERRGWSNPFH
jgi:3-deoxy-7-phosphoheptulonate synthase